MLKRSFALLSIPFFLCAAEPLTEPFVETNKEILIDSTDANLEGELAFSETITTQPITIPTEEQFKEVPLEIKKTKSPVLAGALSALIPGSGHYYLGDYRKASQILGGTLVGGACVRAAWSDESLFKTSFAAMQSISMYSIYAAYRDARIFNGETAASMPRENLQNLTAAPFQWSVIKKPEVWGGFLGALALATGVTYLSHSVSMNINTKYVEPLRAFPVAVGEESLFRGFLQTAFSEKMAPWQAITLSSLCFGAAHIPNATDLKKDERTRYYTFSIPFITTIGAYMGWLTYKNHSLKESVALHAWYDFTLMALDAIASRAAIGGETNLFYNFEF